MGAHHGVDEVELYSLRSITANRRSPMSVISLAEGTLP